MPRRAREHPVLLYLARSALHAADSARDSVRALDALPAMWFEMDKPRKEQAQQDMGGHRSP